MGIKQSTQKDNNIKSKIEKYMKKHSKNCIKYFYINNLNDLKNENNVFVKYISDQHFTDNYVSKFLDNEFESYTFTDYYCDTPDYTLANNNMWFYKRIFIGETIEKYDAVTYILKIGIKISNNNGVETWKWVEFRFLENIVEIFRKCLGMNIEKDEDGSLLTSILETFDDYAELNTTRYIKNSITVDVTEVYSHEYIKLDGKMICNGARLKGHSCIIKIGRDNLINNKKDEFINELKNLKFSPSKLSFDFCFGDKKQYDIFRENKIFNETNDIEKLYEEDESYILPPNHKLQLL